MPKHLYAIPTGTVLPADVSGLPAGSPFVLDHGDGTATLYSLMGTTWVALGSAPGGGGGGGGGGGAAVGVGDFAIWQHYNKPRDAVSNTFNYADDLVDHLGTSILASDSDAGWVENWGSPAPKLAEGLYTVAFSGNQMGPDAAAYTFGFGFWDGTGSSIVQGANSWGLGRTVVGRDDGNGHFDGGGTATMWVPEGTHFDFDGFPLYGTVNATLIITKVG